CPYTTLFRSPLDQHKRVEMDERLTAGQHDHGGTDLPHALDDLVERHLLAARERVLRAAPDAAQRTPGQAHERARDARPGALALDRVEDLRDAEEGYCRLLAHGSGGAVV